MEKERAKRHKAADEQKPRRPGKKNRESSLEIRGQKKGRTDFFQLKEALRSEIAKRRSLENRLEEWEKTYRLVVENSIEGIVVAQDGVLKFANAYAAGAIGLTEEEVMSRSFLDFVHPDDVEMVVKYYEMRTTGEKTPEIYPIRIINKSGEIRWVENKAVAINWAGKPATLNFLNDITERKKTEDVLRESENTLKAILSASPVGIGLVRDGCLDWANTAMYRMLDYEEGSLVGKSARIFYSDSNEYERVHRELHEQTARRGIGQVETRWVKKGGTVIDCYLQGKSLDPSSAQNGTIVTAMDITNLRKTQQLLSTKEKLISSIYENTPIGFYRTTPDGRILDANPAMVKMLGYSSLEELASVNLESSGYHPLYERRLFRERIEQDGEIRGMESFWKRRDNTKLYFRENARAVRDSKGDVLWYEGSLEDMTDQKEAEERIHALTQMLIRSQESERQKISHYLHDVVAQDLSILKMQLAPIPDDFPAAPDKLREKVAELCRIVERIIASVRDLAYDQRPPIMDQLGLIRSVFQYCEEFSQKTGVEVDFHSAGMDEIRLDFDTEINLYRLIQETLINIEKHADASRVTIRLVASFPNIILRIADNGKGFPVESRLNTAFSEKRMGIRSMQERVDLLHGKWKIESRLNEGTKIFVEVPYKGKKSG